MQLRVTLPSPSATFEIPLCSSLYLCASVVVRAVQIDLTRLRSHFRLYICRAFGAQFEHAVDEPKGVVRLVTKA